MQGGRKNDLSGFYNHSPKIKKKEVFKKWWISLVQWHIPVIPLSWEAHAGESQV